MSTVLDVQHLTTHYRTLRGWVKAVEDVSFSIEKCLALGIAGESGCGKTSIALSLLKILPKGGKIRKGSIIFDGVDLVPLSDDEMRKVRWKGISIVFQGAMKALNPVCKIGDQIVEAIRAHEPSVDMTTALERARNNRQAVECFPEYTENLSHA